MTRKDYVLLAAALKAARDRLTGPSQEVDGIDYAAMDIADALAADNPRFDRDRFLRDAGSLCAIGEQMSALERLRYHVSGAIERGESAPITEQPTREVLISRALAGAKQAAREYGERMTYGLQLNDNTGKLEPGWVPTAHFQRFPLSLAVQAGEVRAPQVTP